MESALVTDIAEGGVARGYADAKAQLMAVAAPRLGERRDVPPHLDRHLHGARRWLLAGNGIVEDDQETVAGEILERGVKAIDGFAKTVIIFPQDRYDIFRFCRLGERGEPAQVAAYGGNVAAMAFQKFFF